MTIKKCELWLVLIFCFSLGVCPSYTQINELQIAKLKWSNQNIPLPERLNAVSKLLPPEDEESLNKEKYEQLIPLFKTARSEAHSIGNDSFFVKFSVSIAQYYTYTSLEFDSAQFYIQPAIESCLDARVYRQLPSLLTLTGHIYWKKNRLSEWRYELYKQIPDIEKRVNDLWVLAKCFLEIGNYYSRTGNYFEAISWELKALQLVENMAGANKLNAKLNYQLGLNHRNLENFAKADVYLQRSIFYYKQLKDSINLHSCYLIIAGNEIRQKSYEKAFAYADTATIIARLLNDDILIAKSQIAYGHVLIENDRFEEALPMQLESYRIFLENKMPPTWPSFACYQIGRSYNGLKEYHKALEYAQKGLAGAQGFLNEMTENYSVIYKAWEGLGDYNRAYDAYQQYRNLQDSMMNSRNIERVTQLELEKSFQRERFEDSLSVVKKAQAQELVYQKDILRERTNRNIFLITGVATLVLTLVLFSRLRHNRKMRRILEEKNRQIESEKEKAKISERAKEQFLANMSHEIRTPMHAISGMVKIIQRNEYPAALDVYLNAMQKNSDNLLVILNDVLDMSKIEAGKLDIELVTMSVHELVDNVINILKFRAEEKGIFLQAIIDNEVPAYIKGDPARLNQVLMNLIGNGIKFTTAGSVKLSLFVEKENLKFKIQDTGIGIPEDKLNEIFESFEQIKKLDRLSYGGTGLGLSISKQLVELMRGEIWAESVEEKGSNFYFKIPLMPVNEEESNKNNMALDQQQLTKMASSLKGIKILLVEDNEFNQMIVEDDLKHYIENVEIEICEDGKKAVALAMEKGYDLILMDVHLPKMNGYEASKKIRESEDRNGKVNIPIIAMTASLLKMEIESCYSAGMNNYIPKPYKVESLIRTIYKEINAAI